MQRALNPDRECKPPQPLRECDSQGPRGYGWCSTSAPHGGQLDRLDGLPDPLGVDELGLIEPVHGFSQSVVIGAAHGAHRGAHPRRDERIRAGQADVLTAAIRVVHQALAASAGAAAHEGVLQGEQRQSRGMKAARDRPSHDAPGVDVGDESDSSRTPRSCARR